MVTCTSPLPEKRLKRSFDRISSGEVSFPLLPVDADEEELKKGLEFEALLESKGILTSTKLWTTFTERQPNQKARKIPLPSFPGLPYKWRNSLDSHRPLLINDENETQW